eukprot:1338794-Pleurochrysis_carterae.AAC.3
MLRDAGVLVDCDSVEPPFAQRCRALVLARSLSRARASGREWARPCLFHSCGVDAAPMPWVRLPRLHARAKQTELSREHALETRSRRRFGHCLLSA